MKRGGTGLRVLLLLAGLAALTVATGWMLLGGGRGAETATVLSFPVVALTLWAAVFGVPWQRAPLTHAGLAETARTLGRQASQREAAEQQKFLADTGQARPADLEFSQPELIHWRTDGGRRRGTLSNIAAYYSSLHRGRLLILGEAGAGKTVLANQLLIDLIKGLPTDDPPPGGTLTVPIRLSLPAFDPGDDHERADPGTLADRLNIWIGRQLQTVYGLTPRAAATLLSGGWVLPILDGLDEADLATSPPTRAAAVIRALNHPSGPTPRQAVVTCRTARYQQLTQAEAAPGQGSILQDATVVHIQPLTAAQVTAYLTRRFPDPAHPATIQRRWRTVLHHLTSYPAGPLAITLASPLYLFMATTAYQPTGTDPDRLVGQPAKELRRHLLDSLVPALISQHPRPGGTYLPTDVTRWLTNFANHLHARQVRYGSSGSDIELHHLWTAAGDRTPRYIAAILQTLAVTLSLLVDAGLYIKVSGHVLPHELSDLIPAVGGVTLLAYTSWRATRRSVKLNRLDIRQLSAARNRRAGFGFISGLTLGFMLGFILGFELQYPRIYSLEFRVGMAWGLGFGLASGLALGLAVLLPKRPETISRPSELITQGLAHNTVTWISFGFAGVLTFGLADWLTHIFAPPGARVVFGSGAGYLEQVLFGAAFGAAFGATWISNSPWPRYFIATRILTRHRQLPSRPARFLDWAYEAGLLRLSGVSSQFRHQELQTHLTTPEPASAPAREPATVRRPRRYPLLPQPPIAKRPSRRQGGSHR